ncbi:MAG TPA: xanthine dehydrogenase family protein molybdopterin-binding subunit [Treponema sp.]|nr:xanthine dehydrogenase family protein molybdopterin-binding subunit [Treponema sp.]
MSSSTKPGSAFFSDMSFPDQLYGVLVRSTIQHGYLVDIKPPAMPDGYRLYTATDIPGENRLTVDGTNIPIFTPYEIQYYGEPLGILVGPDHETVQELVASVLVETELLSPLTQTDSFASSQVVAKRIHFSGDPDKKLDKSKNVFETTCETSPQDHFYAEPLGVAVTVSSKKLDIYCATQWPFHVRNSVSAVLDIDPSEILVHPTAIGEPLDGKIWFPSLLAAQAALACVLSHKPVVLSFSRQEDFLFSVKSAPARVQYRTVLDENNALKAMSVRILINAGAYSPLINEIVDRMTIAALGPYYCPEFKVETFALKTSLPPMGAFAGWGEAQVSFALENHIARIQSELKLSPTEWKLENLLDRGSITPTGGELKQVRRYEELFDLVCYKSDFYRKHTAYDLLNRERENLKDTPLRGIAIVCGFQNNGFSSKTPPGGKYAASVTMDTDGKVHISAAITSESMRKITIKHAAKILELETDLIRFTDESSDFLLTSGPETLSGKLTILLPLVEKCCTFLQKQRFRNPLPITVKRTYKPPRSDTWDASLLQGNPYISTTPAVCAVEVELDPLTWTPHVRKTWFAIDAGEILDDRIVRTAIRKSFSAACSKTMAEYLVLRDGRFTPGDSVQYDILQASELPSVDIQLLESAEPPRGVGSIPLLLFPAAFSAALFQILRQGITSLPIRPEDIYTLFAEKEKPV